MNLVLPYPPSANDYWRTVKGRVYVTDRARAYKDAVALYLNTQRIARFEHDVAVSMKVYRPRRIGDLDNTLKVLLDAIKGRVFRDDSQVTLINAERLDDATNPRVELTVASRA